MFCKDVPYQQDVVAAAALPLPWQQLQDKTLLLTGATGLIGTFLMDVLLYRNVQEGMNLHITAVSRKQAVADNPWVKYLQWDVNEPVPADQWTPDFIVHAASNTHPLQYAKDPIGSLMTNLLGTQHLLDLARKAHTQRVVFLSKIGRAHV